jgi:hypothetical protein
VTGAGQIVAVRGIDAVITSVTGSLRWLAGVAAAFLVGLAGLILAIVGLMTMNRNRRSGTGSVAVVP